MAAASVMMFWLLSLKMEITEKNWGRSWFWVSLRIGLKVCDCDVNNIFYLLLARTVTLEKSVAGHTNQTDVVYVFYWAVAPQCTVNMCFTPLARICMLTWLPTLFLIVGSIEHCDTSSQYLNYLWNFWHRPSNVSIRSQVFARLFCIKQDSNCCIHAIFW